jgi:mono/diheme cytochrome c family protein
MKNSYIIVLTLSLIVAIVMAGCGTQAAAETTATQVPPTETAPAPTETSAPTPTDIPTETPTEVPTEPPTEVPAEAPTEAPAAGGATVSFVNDVLPIIESRCVNCHGGQRIEEGLLMRTYEEILAGSNNGPVIVPGDTANSLLVELITAQEMPKRGPKLTPPQVQIITEWVATGAPNN